MVVLRISVVCSVCFLLLVVHPRATAQVFDPPTSDENAKSQGIVTAEASEKVSADSSGVKQTNWYTLPMPKITMPKIEMPRFHMPSFWASSAEASADKPSMFAPVTAGAQKISDGSKKAWEGTKEMFSFSRGTSGKHDSNAASRKRKGPSLWERMFTPKEPEGPRTVAEWMAQPRLDP